MDERQETRSLGQHQHAGRGRERDLGAQRVAQRGRRAGARRPRGELPLGTCISNGARGQPGGVEASSSPSDPSPTRCRRCPSDRFGKFAPMDAKLPVERKQLPIILRACFRSLRVGSLKPGGAPKGFPGASTRGSMTAKRLNVGVPFMFNLCFPYLENSVSLAVCTS